MEPEPQPPDHQEEARDQEEEIRPQPEVVPEDVPLFPPEELVALRPV